MAGEPRTWILTSSPANHAATVAHGFNFIGLKERNRNRALEIEPGDRIVLYLTKVMSFAAVIRVTGELFEDREMGWPGKPGRADTYPWRFPTTEELVLAEADWLPAERLKTELEHIRKWPGEHWKLAFQGQIRPLSPADGAVLIDRLGAAREVRA